jgi:hypothetical protein
MHHKQTWLSMSKAGRTVYKCIGAEPLPMKRLHFGNTEPVWRNEEELSGMALSPMPLAIFRLSNDSSSPPITPNLQSNLLLKS